LEKDDKEPIKNDAKLAEEPQAVWSKPIDERFATPEPHQVPPSKVKALGAGLLVVVSLAAGFAGGWAGQNSRDDAAVSTSRTAQQKVISSESDLINSIAKDVGPSVVSVDVVAQSSTGGGFYGMSPQTEQGAGTGIIIASNGLIVTNRHVVPEGTTDVSVTLSDGTELTDVKVVGRTRATDPLDVAFLKIGDAKGKKLTAAKIGDSSQVEVGDKVIAIGNALGQFQNTVTSGIISGYGRSVQASGSDGSDTENLQDLLQTDTAINQGNSGGPLVNMDGEVIGINTAVAGDAQGIGFAIPTANISGLIKTVISTGEFKQPYLGVRYVPLTNDIASELKLKVTRGAYILTSEQAGGQETIVADSPAAKAGLKAGDVILEVNGTKIDERNGLTVLLNQRSIGDTVNLKIQRDGKDQTIKVELEAAP